MKVAVGSHKGGIIASSEADKEANSYPLEVCEAKRGDVLILKNANATFLKACESPIRASRIAGGFFLVRVASSLVLE